MPEQMALHPLDVDLVDFVDGIADAAIAQNIEEHLRECVVCRIKVQRLRKVPPIELTPLAGVSTPLYDTIDVDDIATSDARAGDLWLTAEDAAMVVLVIVLRADGDVVAVPVVADVEIADSDSAVLDASVSPIGVPIAVFEQLKVNLPLRALAGRIRPLAGRPAVMSTLESGVGVDRGRPIDGMSDPRLEVRQYLIDRLTSLQRADGAASDSSTSDNERVGRLADELRLRRGDMCYVEQLDDLLLTGGQSGDWRGIARVSEFGIRMAIIETPAGLNEAADFVAAQMLIARLDVSAVVVATRLTETVDLFEPQALFEGFELPHGQRSTAPLMGGLDLHDTIAKYLDQKNRAALATSAGQKTGRVDIEQVLTQTVAETIADKISKASRLGDEKRAGTLQLQGVDARLAETLKDAFRPDFNVEDVARILAEDRR